MHVPSMQRSDNRKDWFCVWMDGWMDVCRGGSYVCNHPKKKKFFYDFDSQNRLTLHRLLGYDEKTTYLFFYLRGLQHLRTISYGKAKLLSDNVQNANKFLKNNEFSSKRAKECIPRSFTVRFGNVRKIPISMKENHIMRNVESENWN